MSQEKLAEECADKRLPISVASIKRAETGKKVLFRTVKGLASYFDITVNQLLEDTLAPEQSHADNNDYLSIGRKTKNMLYGIYQQHVIQKENYSVIIYAYYGGGKTTALNFIEEKITKDTISQKRISLTPPPRNKNSRDKNNNDNNNVITTDNAFFRKLLNIGLDIPPSVLRHQINRLTQCANTRKQLYSLSFSENTLHEDSLYKRSEDLIGPNLINLFILAMQQQQKRVLLVDNLHHGSPLIDYTLQAMLNHSTSTPLFIAATSTPTLHPPLSQFSPLHLPPMKKPETETFLQSLHPQNSPPPSSRVTNLHVLSNGNPGLLKALDTHTNAPHANTSYAISTHSNSALPKPLQTHVQQQLEMLSNSAQTSLAQAAKNLSQQHPHRLHLSQRLAFHLINELYMTGLFQLTKSGLVPYSPLLESLILSVVK